MRSRILLAALCLIIIAAFAGCASTEKRRSAGEYMDDKVIAAKVKSDLALDPVTKAHEIEVEVYKGNVQLSGFVDTRESIKRAEEIAKKVKGVQAVENNLLDRSDFRERRP